MKFENRAQVSNLCGDIAELKRHLERLNDPNDARSWLPPASEEATETFLAAARKHAEDRLAKAMHELGDL